jgi:endonuclease/exonuclease/phosphatase (EEP) superfamily protein YafD
LFSPPLAVAGADATPLRVAAANVCFDNDRAGELLPLLAARSVDLVAVCEVTERVRRQLEPLLEQWPHSVVETHEDCYGIALYSRLPLSQTQVLALGTHRAPAIRAVVQTDAGPIGILCMHPPRPGGDDRSNERDRAFQEMESALAPLPPRRIVLGDTNATRWSVPFTTALARNGLRDSSEGHGYQGSWPAGLPGFLRIPIDHVLVTDGIGVPERALLSVPGSDHLAVFAELLLPPVGNGR